MAAQFLSWEHLFRIFGIVPLKVRYILYEPLVKHLLPSPAPVFIPCWTVFVACGRVFPAINSCPSLVLDSSAERMGARVKCKVLRFVWV